MNEGIVRNWNEVVGYDDHAFIIGDIAMGGKSKADKVASYLNRMNGTKYLVPGNHDTYVLDKPCSDYYILLPELCTISVIDSEIGKQNIVLCHYAMKVWHGSHKSNWSLFGHSHHNMPPDYTIKSFDVGIDGPGYDYRPISYAQVKKMMKKHGQEPVDHHGRSGDY